MAKEFKEMGNWKLFGGRQSIGSAMVLSSEKCAGVCRCVHTYIALPGNFRGFLSKVGVEWKPHYRATLRPLHGCFALPRASGHE